jgi:hypothetical protein
VGFPPSLHIGANPSSERGCAVSQRKDFVGYRVKVAGRDGVKFHIERALISRSDPHDAFRVWIDCPSGMYRAIAFGVHAFHV